MKIQKILRNFKLGIESYQVEKKETDDAEKILKIVTVIEPLAKIAPNKVSQSEGS